MLLLLVNMFSVRVFFSSVTLSTFLKWSEYFRVRLTRQKYWISIQSTPESRRQVLNYFQNHNSLKSGILSHLPSVFSSCSSSPSSPPPLGAGLGGEGEGWFWSHTWQPWSTFPVRDPGVWDSPARGGSGTPHSPWSLLMGSGGAN